MKKLTVIIALMLVVTIGGVYATWNYAQGEVLAVDEYLDGTTTRITEKVIDTAKGKIAIDDSNFSIVIDDANNDKQAELVVSGSIQVTFTPSDGADETVTASGIPLQFTISHTGMVHDGQPIFTYVSGPVAINGGAPVKSVQLTQTELQIGFTQAIVLPTANDYDLFKQDLHNGSLCITVAEFITTP